MKSSRRRNDTLFELSHEKRRAIVEMGIKGSLRHSEIGQALNMSPSETTRHLRRLIEAQIMVRKNDGAFGMTRFGKLLVEQAGTLEFITANEGYFQAHDIASVPDWLENPGALMKSTRLDGTMEVLSHILRMNAGAHEYIDSIQPEFTDAIVLAQSERLREGVALSILTTERSKLPSEYFIGKTLNLSVRTAGSLPLFFIRNENEGLVCFAHPNGEVDYSVAWTSKGESFVEWCGLLFLSQWERARPAFL